MNMKIKDIARIAGVSVSTVSRVTNGYTNVPQETYERVMKVINEYGYVPNEYARMMTGKQNKTLGLFIMDIGYKGKDYFISSFWHVTMLATIVNSAANSEYTILVTLVNDKNKLKKVKDLFVNKTICGGIFIGLESKTPEIEELDKLGYKVAILEQEKDSNRKNTLYVNSNNIQGAYEATKYLINNGHKKIVHLAGNMKKSPTGDRIIGYKNALAEHDIPFNKDFVIKAEFAKKIAFEKTIELIDQGVEFTAIFAANDDMAQGAIEALNSKGLSVPDDISIVGYDDTLLARFTNFSSVKVHPEECAEILVNNLIKLIENPEKVSPSFVIDSELVIRNSVKKI